MLSIIYNNSNPYPFLIFRYFFQWSLGFLILGELITPKVIISMLAVIIGIYIVKKGSNIKVV